ncbi:MAG: riboflavin synthase [Chitinophagales bacterium]
MFTGIVQGSFAISSLLNESGIARIGIVLPAPLRDGLAIGASVAIDGVCLTVTEINDDLVRFDAIDQTLKVTTLGELVESSKVNIERSFKQGVEVGGHIVSGHIDDTAEIVKIADTDNNRTFTYKVSPSVAKYILDKGFIAVNGCSLTVARIDKQANTFDICYIPETLRVTTHGDKAVGSFVNIEVDRQTQAIVDTVERVLRDNPQMIKDILQG